MECRECGKKDASIPHCLQCVPSKEEFDHDASNVTLLIYLIEKWFGERCPNYNENCECCRRWQAFDLLMENPFDER